MGIDIDPKTAAFSSKRAAIRGFGIQRICSSYDNLAMINLSIMRFDIALFCASLHHSTKPRELLSELKGKIHEEGIIAFIEEPVNSIWWRHWGLRLDLESINAIAQFGWFESGFSHDYLELSARQSGLKYSSGLNAIGDRKGYFSTTKRVMESMDGMLHGVGYSRIPTLTEPIEPLAIHSGSLRVFSEIKEVEQSSTVDVFVEIRNSVPVSSLYLGTIPYELLITDIMKYLARSV